MADVEFDPEIHQSDAGGNPVLTQKGEYARRRGPRKGTATSPNRRTASAPKKGQTDYRPGINGMFQMATMPLAFKAPADAAAVLVHGPNISEALNELAKERPEVATVLERLLSVGPYGLLLSATIPLIVQILHNHNIIPEQVAVGVGAMPREVLLAQVGLSVPPVKEAHDVAA